MATMHPEKLDSLNCTKSELLFYEALKKALPEKCHVFYSVRWITKDTNGQKKQSECDFLVFHPDFGYLTIEVKGGKSIDINEDTWVIELAPDDDLRTKTYRELTRSPYAQSSESMHFFKDYLQDELECKYPGIFGCAVAFPLYNIDNILATDAPREQTIEMRDMQNLGKRINEIFHYSKPYCPNQRFISKEYAEKFVKTIKKKIALSAAAGALIPLKEIQLNEINHVQDAIIDLLYNYNKAFLMGGAGTGKTWIGIKKIRKALFDNKDVLFLCYNSHLCEFIRNSVSDPNFSCYTFEAYMLKLLGSPVFDSVPKDTNDTKEFFDTISEKAGIKKFDLIIVDEGQDFTEDWATSINYLLKPQGSLYVLFDQDQNIFKRDFKNGFCIDSPPFVLRYNIRNTRSIHQWICSTTNVGKEMVSNSLLGSEPETYDFTSRSTALSKINNILNTLINKENVEPASIVLLSNRRIENSILNESRELGTNKITEILDPKAKNEVVFRTIQGFKGLESDVVIYVNHYYKNQTFDDAYYKQLYTACTRAKYFLYVINIEIQKS